MKKLITLLLAATMIFSLAGCSESFKEDIKIDIKNEVDKFLEEPKEELKQFEDMLGDWPNNIPDIVDDIWNEFESQVTKPDYTSPDDEIYNPPTDDKDNNNDNKDETVNVGDMQIHFIDVGQADCILMINGDDAFMIDAGNNSDGELILDYLENLNIDEIDHFVLTHPHEDHIGGADTVINGVNVENVYMTEYGMSTKTYKDVISAINSNAIVPTYVEKAIEVEFGDADVLIYPPATLETDNVNDTSIIVHVTHGNNTMLFAGDTESDAEKETLELDYKLEADLFKANHHGSGGANSYVWLREVNPKYVIIQVGVDNKYDHPHEEAMSRFNDVGAYIWRNDTMGHIVVTSDGEDFTFNQDGIKPTREHTDK